MPNVTYVTDIPQWSNGKPGDTAGTMAFTQSNIFYCFKDYTDGYSPIWSKTSATLQSLSSPTPLDWQNPITKETRVLVSVVYSRTGDMGRVLKLPATVKWTSQNSTSLVLNNQPVALTGTRTVNSETTLIFVVNGPRGPTTQTIRITTPPSR
jgi:hypothetical protein